MSRIAADDFSNSPVERYTFVVAQNDRGQWVAREKGGWIEGVFVTQRDAIRFARSETEGRAGAVVVEDAGLSNRH